MPSGSDFARAGKDYPYCPLLRHNDDFLNHLTRIRAEANAVHPAQQTATAWLSGRNAVIAFQDDEIVVVVGDMFAALNPGFLSEMRADVVVNLIGPPAFAAGSVEEKVFWTTTSHWEGDREEYARICGADQPGDGPDRLRAVEDYFRTGPAEFYKKLGIEYVEEPTDDNMWFRISGHFPRVNRAVQNCLSKLAPQKAAAVSNGAPPRPLVVLFHCYGGHNRSASVLLGFWYHHLVNTQRRVPAEGGVASMKRLIETLVRIRPECLAKRGESHMNFIGCLLEYADTTSSEWEEREITEEKAEGGRA